MAPKRKSTEAASSAKKAKAAKEAPAPAADAPKAGTASAAGGARTLVIEHWANKIVTAVKAALPDAVIKVNEDKPRKGAFVITDGTGKEYISLLDMPRPFTKLKALDMDALAAQVVEGLGAWPSHHPRGPS